MLEICGAEKQILVEKTVEQCNEEPNACALIDRFHLWLTGEELKPFVPAKNIALLANEPTSGLSTESDDYSMAGSSSQPNYINPVDAVEAAGYLLYFSGWAMCKVWGVDLD